MLAPGTLRHRKRAAGPGGPVGAVLVGMGMLAKHRDRELRHQTIGFALENGQPVPPELLPDLFSLRCSAGALGYAASRPLGDRA